VAGFDISGAEPWIQLPAVGCFVSPRGKKVPETQNLMQPHSFFCSSRGTKTCLLPLGFDFV